MITDTERSLAHAAVTAQAWRVDDPESPDHGRSLVHCLMSFTGANWDEAAVHELIDRADLIAWRPHLFSGGPCLYVEADGWRHYFDTIRLTEERP